MIENQNNEGGFFNEWRQGRLARKPGVATAVLTAALIITVLWARHYVQSQKLDIEFRQQALASGEALIKQVATDGLEHYLGSEPIVRYFMLEDKGRPAGLGALFFAKKTENDAVFWVSKEILISTESKYQMDAEFVAPDNLSEFSLQIQHTLKEQIIQSKRLICTQGEYYIVPPQGRPQRLDLGTETDTQAIIPPMLLDFFSSLACQNNPNQAAAFRFIDIHSPTSDAQFGDIFDVVVSAGAKFRSDTPKTSGAHDATVEWYSRTGQNKYRKQYIEYDEKNQIVLQEEDGASSVYKAVDPKRLSDTFPKEAELIKRWIEANVYESSDLL